jgi:sortase (surface protein transpeptidase)
MDLTIPAIHVQSSLMVLGKASDGTVQVPPLSDVAQAGWYKYSPTPGATGPAVILGHIDSAEAGKGVFFNLGALRQGDVVTVLRTDHQLATFTVTRVLESPKTAFPASEVYGNTVDPELRLITCGGQFDASARSYEDNILVFASLTSLKAA